MVVTKIGQGKVVAQEILARKILVRYDGPRDVLTEEREVLTVIKGGARVAAPEDDDSPPERRPDRDAERN
jgi:hypothetical protein